MDKLTINDLAMYIGCEVIFVGHSSMGINFRNYKKGGRFVLNTQLLEAQKRDFEIKPILRPLSDINKVEFNEYAEITGINPGDFLGNGINWINISARGTKYLISKQFDLFNWIEKGLAIDKTTLNTNSNDMDRG